MPAQSRVKRIRASYVVISVYSASVILASPARRGKHYLLIYRSPDQGYASTFHAKNARLATRTRRRATPRLGHIGTWSRQHTPPHVIFSPQTEKRVLTLKKGSVTERSIAKQTSIGKQENGGG